MTTALVIGRDEGVGAQLRALGVEDVDVVEPDLRAIAARARAAAGELVLAHGDILTNAEALAGLVEDARIVSGALIARDPKPGAPPLRVRGGQIVSAGSDHHTVSAPDAAFLGVLKVGAVQRELLAQTAERVAALGDGDPLALLTVGLVRAGVPLRTAPLRGMVWERPGTQQGAAAAARVDEDRARMDSAVKSVDGFFTTFFVSPYSRHLARWAARRRLTPNQVTAASLAIGLVSAACFATGERWGLIAGAVALQAAFTADCVDGQLARYTRRFSQLGAWLDATFDRLKEWLVFAGLAIGAQRAGHPVWVLAAAALTLQTYRHTMDFAWHTARRARAVAPVQPPVEEPGDVPAAAAPAGELGGWRALDRFGPVPWIKRVIAFPIGERFALVSITAAVWSAHTTFVAWLAWGGFAVLYSTTGRVLRSLRLPRGGRPDPPRALERFRDDGPLARALGKLGAPLPALPLVAAAALPLFVAIAIAGDGAADSTAVAVVAWAVVLAGLSASRTGQGRLRWAVPPLLRATEYAALLWLGVLAGRSSVPAAFALLATLALRQYDIVYGLRYRGAPPGAAAEGWDGRLALACVLLIGNALPAAYYALAAIIAAVFATTAIRDWSRARMPVTFHDDKEDVEA